MKANSLSISIPVGTKGVFTCNKNCPYCVSKMGKLFTIAETKRRLKKLGY